MMCTFETASYGSSRVVRSVASFDRALLPSLGRRGELWFGKRDAGANFVSWCKLLTDEGSLAGSQPNLVQ